MKANVTLYRFKKLSTGEHPLIIMLRDGAKRKKVSLGVSLPANRWNFKRNNYKPTPIIEGITEAEADKIRKDNAEIIALVESTNNKYAEKIRELATARKQVSLDTLVQMVEQPIKTDYLVLQWMEKLRDDFRVVDKIGQANIYDNARRLLDLFLKGKDIAFDEVDLAFLYRYEHFLRQRRLKSKDNKPTPAIKDSSISIYLRTLRAAIAKAVKLGYAKGLAFSDYKMPKGKANKRALSIKDIEAILKLENRTDDNFRYLVFSYFTIGMNFTDIARLTWDNIRGNEVHYTRQKVHHKMIIPIHTKVKEILDYYRPITGNITAITGANDNYIFPILDKDVHKTEAQKENRTRKMLKSFNKELKNIGTAAKVDTILTSYVLRHTAITNLVRAGITADAIQALAGHKRLTTTENYIQEASQQQKAKAVNSL
jgi:integrase